MAAIPTKDQTKMKTSTKEKSRVRRQFLARKTRTSQKDKGYNLRICQLDKTASKGRMSYWKRECHFRCFTIWQNFSILRAWRVTKIQLGIWWRAPGLTASFLSHSITTKSQAIIYHINHLQRLHCFLSPERSTVQKSGIDFAWRKSQWRTENNGPACNLGTTSWRRRCRW